MKRHAPRAAGTAPLMPHRGGQRSQLQTGFAVTGVLLVVATCVLAFGHLAGKTATLTDALSTFASFLAAGCCAYAMSKTQGASRWSWALFGSTMIMWTSADALWFLDGFFDGFHVVIPVANYLYILGLIPVIAGLLLFPVGKWEQGRGSATDPRRPRARQCPPAHQPPHGPARGRRACRRQPRCTAVRRVPGDRHPARGPGCPARPAQRRQAPRRPRAARARVRDLDRGGQRLRPALGTR